MERVGCKGECATRPRLQEGPQTPRHNQLVPIMIQLEVPLGPQTHPPPAPHAYCASRGLSPIPHTTPSHRVRLRGWDTQLSCHHVTVTPTCHLTCGLRGRARRGRATPEPHWHRGPSDPHDLANPQGRMSPWPGLPSTQQPWSRPAHHSQPPQHCSLHQATPWVPREAYSQQDMFLFKVAS